MQPIDVSFTSGYSIGLAMALNPNNPSRPMRAAAELWHLLCWKYDDLSTDPRVAARDGFFYVGAKWFERFTGYDRRTFTEACKTLQQAGLIEYKRMFALGTSTSYNHFKLLYPSWLLAPDNEHFVKGVCKASANSDGKRVPVSQWEAGAHSYNKEENIKRTHKDSQPTPARLGVASSENASPFDDNPKQDVTPLKKNEQGAKRRRSFAILGEFYKEFKWKGKPTQKEAAVLDAALDAGRSVEEIREALRWINQHDFWGKKEPAQKLSDTALKQYDATMASEQGKAPKGVW